MIEYELSVQRWEKLFQKDSTLRPDNLMLIVAEWHMKVPEGRVPLTTVKALIVDSAIRWLNGKHESLTIGDGSRDPDYKGVWPCGYSVEVISPVIAENVQSADTLIDVLYKAVMFVMDREAEMIREDKKRNSLWGRIKRRLKVLNPMFESDPTGRLAQLKAEVAVRRARVCDGLGTKLPSSPQGVSGRIRTDDGQAR